MQKATWRQCSKEHNLLCECAVIPPGYRSASRRCCAEQASQRKIRTRSRPLRYSLGLRRCLVLLHMPRTRCVLSSSRARQPQGVKCREPGILGEREHCDQGVGARGSGVFGCTASADLPLPLLPLLRASVSASANLRAGALAQQLRAPHAPRYHCNTLSRAP